MLRRMSETTQPAEKVRIPGLLLAAWGVLSVLWGLVMTAISIFGMPLQQQILESAAQDGRELPPIAQQLFNSPLLGAVGAIGILLELAKVGLSVYVAWGGWQMTKLRHHGACMGAVIVAMLPCTGAGCCCIFGLPFAIWALTVLNRADVRASFGLSNSN